ncbi:MAG TPA: hypothetical protein VLA66_12380 [Thermoanaerobaculia bacterium]|nr:hypothetical protein [Thermoanaerobaculia bacterium]
MSPDNRTHRRIPTLGTLVLVAACALAALGAVAAPAQQQTWSATGALDASDPTYRRVFLLLGECRPSTIGADVHYDVHELVLVDGAAPTHLSANTCFGTSFDTVFYFYQRLDGSAAAFSPTSPCDHLVGYSDDACDVPAAITSNGLVPGHLTMVVTSYEDGTTGSYLILAASNDAQLDDFIFYDGFEPDSRNWSSVVP